MIRILGYLFTLVLFLSCSEQVDDRSGRVQLKFDRPTPTNLSIVDVNHPINSKILELHHPYRSMTLIALV